MSIFYRAFLRVGRDVPLEEVKLIMVEPLVGKPAKEHFLPKAYDFSYSILRNLGFSMNKDEVIDAWRPVESRIQFVRLDGIFWKEGKDGLIKAFDYVELMSLQGGIFAREDQLTKVLHDQMWKAYKLLKCPFPLEGWCD